MTIAVRAAELGDLDLLVRFNAAMALETEGLALDPARLRAGILAVLGEARSSPQGGLRGAYRMASDLERPGSEPVGALLVTREWSDWRDGWFWWIQSVYVEPGARRRGVFAALYHDVLARARARDDVRGVRLYVERENQVARGVYRRLGMGDSSYRIMEVDP